MKRLMYFVGMCALCATIATACTNNETETKNEQEVTNLEKETVKDTTEQKENDVAIEVKGEYFIINKELFKDEFNFIASNMEIPEMKNWEYQEWELGGDKVQYYFSTVDNEFSIKLMKAEQGQNFDTISVDSVYNSEEDDTKVFATMFAVAMMCEQFNSSDISQEFREKFGNDMTKAFMDVISTKERKYIHGKKCAYAISYNASDVSADTILFVAMPIEEEKISTENDGEAETETNKISTDTSKPTEQEIEIYNYINNLLEMGVDTSQEPSVSEIASYFGISEEMVDGNYNAYKQGYLEHTYEDYCDKLTSEKYGISIDEVNKIWTKVYSYENK